MRILFTSLLFLFAISVQAQDSLKKRLFAIELTDTLSVPRIFPRNESEKAIGFDVLYLGEIKDTVLLTYPERTRFYESYIDRIRANRRKLDSIKKKGRPKERKQTKQRPLNLHRKLVIKLLLLHRFLRHHRLPLFPKGLLNQNKHLRRNLIT